MVVLLLQDSEVLNAWLTDFHFEEYYQLFINAGYDMPTVSRMTPEVRTMTSRERAGDVTGARPWAAVGGGRH